MKFRIEELTTPLTADVLNRKDFSFSSGGGGGGGTTVAIQPVGDILSDGVSTVTPAVAIGESKVLASVSMNLVGGRRLFMIATVGPLNYAVSGPGATSTFELWVGGVMVASIVNPAANPQSIITFQGVQLVTSAGAQAMELRIANGPIALTSVNATITVMEFVNA